ncbi:MAG: phosphomannose isomerase type II C-terminal cupin domain [Actinomycetota bacterium]|nr:phosphomannose isomerase type II C-terminal cupin domain [Actinomycetota bacterium]
MSVRDEILGNIVDDARPWGGFRQFTHNTPCTVKILTVADGQVLSLQSHRHRDELWVVLDPGLRIEIDDEVHHPEPGAEFVVARGSRHRAGSAAGTGRILEISFGEFDEDDIERFEDAYGRS